MRDTLIAVGAAATAAAHGACGGLVSLICGFGRSKRARWALGLLAQHPVELAVVGVVVGDEEVLEQALEVVVVRLVVEAQRAAVLKVDAELVRVALAEGLEGGRDLLLHDALVLLLLGVGAQALPGQRAAQEVHEHEAERLQIVAPALLDAQVVVDARVARRAGEVLVLAVGNVGVRLGVPVALGQTKVDDVDGGRLAAQADEEVVGLDVAVDEVLGMHVLDAAQQPIRDHEHCLEAEAAAAVVEQILQRRSQQVQNHHVVVALHPVPAHRGDAGATREHAVQLALVHELGVLGLHGLQLDCHLLPRGHIHAQVDVAKRPAPDLTAQPILLAYAQLHAVSLTLSCSTDAGRS
mmetsp:Transcript_1763/g.5240  ORF Transcript_1763/g.5240 Transcript_1763/m.5240 type:complete len:352 (+) Transcript_1763:405-1460(+)